MSDKLIQLKQAAMNIKLDNEAKLVLVSKISNQITDDRSKSKNMINKKIIKAAVAAAAIFILCFSMSIPAIASNVSIVYDGLYAISPAVAQYFKPVERSCTDQGIRMEVISAYIHEDKAEVYIAMTDLEGDRVDETLDLYDSYDINTAFGYAGMCEFAGYDDETKTAVFHIRIEHMEGQKITGKKITFSVSKLLCGKDIINIELDAVNPEAIPESPETVYNAETGTLVLSEFEKPVFIPGDGAAVTAYGFIDGKVHIQVRYDNIAETDNHGWIYLSDESGEKIINGEAVIFDSSDSTADNKSRYYEYIFELEDIRDPELTLMGEFVLCDTLINGDWEITFPLEDVLTE